MYNRKLGHNAYMAARYESAYKGEFGRAGRLKELADAEVPAFRKRNVVTMTMQAAMKKQSSMLQRGHDA